MKHLAFEVMEKHQSRNPYEIARKENIIVVFEPLGNIYGYYNNAMGQKFIHINEELPEYFQRYVVTHLLYKAFTNSDEMQFLKQKTSNRFTASEIEANKFAAYLKYDEKELMEAGSFKQALRNHGMKDEDFDDLSNRIIRFWGNEAGSDIEEQVKFILNKTFSMDGQVGQNWTTI